MLEKGHYSEADARSCFLQIMRAIQYLHSRWAGAEQQRSMGSRSHSPPPGWAHNEKGDRNGRQRTNTCHWLRAGPLCTAT